MFVAVCFEPNCCLQTTTGHLTLFQSFSILSQDTQQIIPSLPAMQAKSISTFLNINFCVFWVTGTPAACWPGLFSRIRPVTVMDWFHPGSPLDKPNTADVLRHRWKCNFEFYRRFFWGDLWFHAHICLIQLNFSLISKLCNVWKWMRNKKMMKNQFKDCSFFKKLFWYYTA